MIGGETHAQVYNAMAGPTIALTIPVEAEALTSMALPLYETAECPKRENAALSRLENGQQFHPTPNAAKPLTRTKSCASSTEPATSTRCRSPRRAIDDPRIKSYGPFLC